MSTVSSPSLLPQPLKVLALLSDGWGMPGGIARYNQDLMTALAASPVVGDIAALARYAAPVPGPPSKVFQLASRAGKIDYALAAFRQVMSKHYDLIFCGHIFMAPLGAALAALARAPLWLQLHGIESWARPSPAIRHAARRARLITAVSRTTRQRALAWCDIEPERVRVLPNTVDERFSPAPAPAELARRLGTQGRKVILTVGRLSPLERYKGHDRIIEALPRIRLDHPNILYVIAGGGDDQAYLAEIARGLGVTDLVRFTGPVSFEELPQIYRLADVFAMPSTGEGFGIVFLEAAATGLPIVAGNCDGSIDALVDGELGVLVPPGHSPALADAIIACLARGPGKPERVRRFAFSHFAAQVDHLVSSRF